jgi:hypothetical protein
VDVALTWAARFYAGVVAILVIYLGVAMWMAIRESKRESKGDGDPQASICYQVFRDLVELLYRLFSWRGM